MTATFPALAMLIMVVLSTNALALPELSDTTGLAKYVSINIEIKELKESGLVLQDATDKLSLALDSISENLDELSPEQLRLINSLADKVDGITNKLNHAVSSLPTTIENAQKPTNELLRQSLNSIREETITPLISSIDRWLIITISFIVLLGAAFIGALLILLKKVSDLGSNIKTIADGYRVIPVEQYKESIGPP